MMRIAAYPALSLAVFLSAMAAAAETPLQSPIELTADAAVRAALTANRELQAAIETIGIARGPLLQAGRLANPELELGYADDFAFGAEGERAGSVGFAQSFPITARLAREKDVAAMGVAIAEAEVRDFVRTLVAETQSVFYSVRALDERIDVHRQLIESVHRVEEVTKRRLEAAEVSPAELSLLRIERLRLEQDAQRLLREREVAAAALARLLGRTALDGLRPVGELDPGPDPSPAPIPRGAGDASRRPDLDAASDGVERAEADRDLSRTEVWEDWTVRLAYARDRQVFDDPIGVQQDSFLSLGVTIPVPLWNRQQGRIAAADAEFRRARHSRDALLLRIEEQIRSAESRVRTLRSGVAAYAEEILPEATRSQELFERGYRQGLVGISELLQAQRQYNESRALHLELLGELRQAAIQLETATGTSPHLTGFPSQGVTP